MTCAEYAELVAADVDGALGGEAEEARRHAESCESCRMARERQLAVRDLLRSRALLVPAPPGLRDRILEALPEERDAARARRRSFFAPLAGLGLAGAAAALVLLLWGRDTSFAPHVESYELASSGRLALTIRTSSPAELEAYFRAHRDQGFPDHVVDLSAVGYRLVGATLAEYDGRKVRLAVYTDGANLIVCDYQFAGDFPIALPANGEPVFFRKDGVSFCARRMGNEICLLASRMGIAEFRRTLGA